MSINLPITLNRIIKPNTQQDGATYSEQQGQLLRLKKSAIYTEWEKLLQNWKKCHHLRQLYKNRKNRRHNLYQVWLDKLHILALERINEPLQEFKLLTHVDVLSFFHFKRSQ